MTAEPRPADADGVEELADPAEVAAALYAAFLNVNIPGNIQGMLRFTPDQAFELTRALFYESLRDEEQ